MDFEITPLGLQLTRLGINEAPSLSPDQKQIVFTSRKRANHLQQQVYILDLESRRERRLTFQDGDCSDPIFLNQGKQIVYASTTDELKENPVLFQKKAAPSPWPPSDLYISDLIGEVILRLTNRAGFDGQPWQISDRTLLYSRAEGSALETWQLHLDSKLDSKKDSKKAAPLLVVPDHSIESLRIAPNRTVAAWIQHSPEQVRTASVQNLRASKDLKLPEGKFRDLHWFTNEKLLFSARILKKEFYQIYVYDVKTQCLQNLVESPQNLFYPQPLVGNTEILFAADLGKGSQLFKKSIPTSDACLQWEVVAPAPPNLTEAPLKKSSNEQPKAQK